MITDFGVAKDAVRQLEAENPDPYLAFWPTEVRRPVALTLIEQAARIYGSLDENSRNSLNQLASVFESITAPESGADAYWERFLIESDEYLRSTYPDVFGAATPSELFSRLQSLAVGRPADKYLVRICTVVRCLRRDAFDHALFRRIALIALVGERRGQCLDRELPILHYMLSNGIGEADGCYLIRECHRTVQRESLVEMTSLFLRPLYIEAALAGKRLCDAWDARRDPFAGRVQAILDEPNGSRVVLDGKAFHADSEIVALVAELAREKGNWKPFSEIKRDAREPYLSLLKETRWDAIKEKLKRRGLEPIRAIIDAKQAAGLRLVLPYASGTSV